MSRIYISMLTNPSLTNANHNWNQIDWKAFLSITCYCVQQGRRHTGRRLARPQSYLDLLEIYVRKPFSFKWPSITFGIAWLKFIIIAVYKIALLLTASGPKNSKPNSFFYQIPWNYKLFLGMFSIDWNFLLQMAFYYSWYCLTKIQFSLQSTKLLYCWPRALPSRSKELKT